MDCNDCKSTCFSDSCVATCFAGCAIGCSAGCAIGCSAVCKNQAEFNHDNDPDVDKAYDDLNKEFPGIN
jgi:hypothetical protein